MQAVNGKNGYMSIRWFIATEIAVWTVATSVLVSAWTQYRKDIDVALQNAKDDHKEMRYDRRLANSEMTRQITRLENKIDNLYELLVERQSKLPQ